MKQVPNFKPQSEFPLLETFRKHFPITYNTIFAYDDTIYTNNELPNHIIVHEVTHLKQQERQGLERWVTGYISIPQYRLEQELEAYRAELASIANREIRFKVMADSAKKLSSPLYGDLLTFNEALMKLRI